MDSTGDDSQNDFKERLNALLKGPDIPEPAGKLLSLDPFGISLVMD